MSDLASKTLVTVGIPTYNRAYYLETAIVSILDQTYSNVELIISDNASTDDTEAICQKFTAGDCRIRYVRQDNNIGPSRNFYEVLRLARGEYFAWLADDDWCDRRFLEALASELQARPDVILCACGVKVIDAHGNNVAKDSLERIHPNIPWEKARVAFFEYPISSVVHAVYGLYRTAIVRMVGAPRGVTRKNILTSSEVPFLAKLATMGRIIAIPELLRYYRIHENSVYQSERRKMSNVDRVHFRLAVLLELCSIVGRSSLPYGQKVKIGVVGGVLSLGKLLVVVGRRIRNLAARRHNIVE